MHHTVSGLLGIKPRFILELHLNHHFEGVILPSQRTKNVLENVKKTVHESHRMRFPLESWDIILTPSHHMGGLQKLQRH